MPDTEKRSTAPQCMDCTDWIVVAFVFSFAAAGFVYCEQHPSDIVFPAWLGIAGVLIGAFHFLRVRDQKIPDAEGRDA